MSAKKNLEPAKRVLVIEDHPVMRLGIVSLIESQKDLTVCEADDGSGEILKIVEQSSPDIVLVDIALGDNNGVELLQDLRVNNKSLPVLCYSFHDEQIYAERILHCGGQGYIEKGASSETLLCSIRGVLKGYIVTSEKVGSQLLKQMNNQAGSDKMGVESLSNRELEVFECEGQGLTTSQTAEKLYLSPKTIETYKRRIKQKLELDNYAQLRYAAMQWSQSGI